MNAQPTIGCLQVAALAAIEQLEKDLDQIRIDAEASNKELEQLRNEAKSLRGSCKAMGEELSDLRQRNKSLARGIVWFADHIEETKDVPGWLGRIVRNLLKKGDS